MRFKQWIENTQEIEVALNKLFGWKTKVVQSIENVRNDRLSYTKGAINVSRLDSPRGAFFVLDGHHRVLKPLRMVKSQFSLLLMSTYPELKELAGHSKTWLMKKCL